MNDRDKTATATKSAPDRTIFSLLHAARVLEGKVETALDSVGLSVPKYSVLSELVSADAPLSLGELAGKLSCVKSNMTQLVDRLEADGLVRRVDDPKDRRSVKAAITEEGRAKQAAGAEKLDELHERFSASVDDNDRSAVQRLLTALE
jgi:DNA-binding MarR family transcriptional regulator